MPHLSQVPESFHVLIKELQSLGLDVELLEKKKKGNRVAEDIYAIFQKPKTYRL
jgi:hypothetical protein